MKLCSPELRLGLLRLSHSAEVGGWNKLHGKKGVPARTSTIKLVRVRCVSIWVGNYAYLFHGRAFLFIEALDKNDFSRFLRLHTLLDPVWYITESEFHGFVTVGGFHGADSNNFQLGSWAFSLTRPGWTIRDLGLLALIHNRLTSRSKQLL